MYLCAVVQDMYESCKTMVRCAVGVTEKFKVEVGLHQGSEPLLICSDDGKIDR